MKSFNAFISKRAKTGGSMPIWLGTVSPVPKGGVLASDWTVPGMLVPAGAPINLKNGVITPFCAFEVVSVDALTHKITIKNNPYFDVMVEANDIISVVGATFATTSAAEKVSSVAAGATEGQTVLTMADDELDDVTAGTFLALSSASASAASGASIKFPPTHYLYNDIYIEKLQKNEELISAYATGAAVNFHGEGILIDRTIGREFKSQLLSAIPNVIHVED